ncbi:hypothetical protein Fcan01_25126 [Folsomia candida]|uniref:Uncharacterized protein n=1 Tax=Folsomia candida TaxID=158441 RepID=A0A226D5C5_FOLCA|nr:hypothetical protein Fcan01_25126 [Folsomia candida]
MVRERGGPPILVSCIPITSSQHYTGSLPLATDQLTQVATPSTPDHTICTFYIRPFGCKDNHRLIFRFGHTPNRESRTRPLDGLILLLSINSVGDFCDANINERIYDLHVSSRRHLLSEVETLKSLLSTVEVSSDLPILIKYLVFGQTSEYAPVTKASAYLSSTRIADYINWVMVEDASLTDKSWAHLKGAEIKNPEKDIICKIWHNKGLTPKLAFSIGIYYSRDCPYYARTLRSVQRGTGTKLSMP